MVNGVHGQPGDVFLVYLRGSALLQAETLDTLPVASIVDSQTLARLTQAMMASPQ